MIDEINIHPSQWLPLFLFQLCDWIEFSIYFTSLLAYLLMWNLNSQELPHLQE